MAIALPPDALGPEPSPKLPPSAVLPPFCVVLVTAPVPHAVLDDRPASFPAGFDPTPPLLHSTAHAVFGIASGDARSAQHATSSIRGRQLPRLGTNPPRPKLRSANSLV